MRAMDVDWYSARIAAVDVETTGKGDEDRIVELGIVIAEAGQVVSRESWRVNPGIPIPVEASAIHGIYDADVADAPRIEDIGFQERIVGCQLLAYNAPFDERFLALGQAYIDPLIWVREIQRYKKGKKLTDACQRLGIQLDNAHAASADAEAAYLVMCELRHDHRVPKGLRVLLATQRRLGEAQEKDFADWKRRNPR